MVSVLILTFNEEVNLSRCLKSVMWSDDVLVLDSFSRDKTVAIAKEHGIKVIQHEFINFAEQRNFGLSYAGFKYEWVLHLDADEVVSPELKDEILQATGERRFDGYRLASKMMFQGRWLRHSGLYPWHQVRLGRRDRLRFVQVGHGQRETIPSDRLGTLKEPLLHYSFAKGMSDWIQRHNRYSTAEAERFLGSGGNQPIDWSGIMSFGDRSRLHRALKHLLCFMPFRPALRFFYMYCMRLGFLEGRAGFTYCVLLSIYEYFTVLKIRELRRLRRGLDL